jgi:hypothetical protein
MAEIPGAAAATPAAIPGVAPEASARLLALLSAEPAVEEVWLYGSRAMGRHHAGSDIDLTRPCGIGMTLVARCRFDWANAIDPGVSRLIRLQTAGFPGRCSSLATFTSQEGTR